MFYSKYVPPVANRKVVNVHKSRRGRCYAVVERPLTKDFVVARGYVPTNGTWAQGEYGYSTRKQANNRAKYLAQRDSKFYYR